MQANKEEVRVHLHAGQLQIAAALACAHAHMASSMLRPCPIYFIVQHRFSDQSMISPNLLKPITSIRTTTPGLLASTICRVAMMIAVTTATITMTTVRKARGPGNFVNADQITPYAADQTFYLKLSHVLIFF